MCHLPLGESKFVHFSENKRTFGNWLFTCVPAMPNCMASFSRAQVEISARLPGETIGPHAKFMFQPGMKIWLRLPVGDIFQFVWAG